MRDGGISPNITLQQFKTQMILSRGALYDFILRSSVRDISSGARY
jgi:hypothetical protein